MKFTGSARFHVRVGVDAPEYDDIEGQKEAKRRMREVMRRFVEMAAEEGVQVLDIEDTLFSYV